jgi:outer membrane lipoprotein-sorting protein
MTPISRLVPAAVAGLALAMGAATALAQDGKKGTPQAGWSTQAKADPGGALTLDERQTQIIKRIDGYFSELVNMKGLFVQTGADGKRMRGKFFVKKPGRFRFDYNLPSRQIVMSDGRFLRIYDQDIDKEDNAELDQTPFRVLLKKDVDLLRDARIDEVQEADDVIVLAIQDKSPDTPGRIKLIFVKKPALELKEWVTTDAQGLDTRMELSDVNRTEDIDAGLFKPLPFKTK